MSLYDRWVVLHKDAGLKTDHDKTFRDLMKSYSTPPRAYHNLVHIGHCLDELEPVLPLAHDPIALRLAVWFHDAIYELGPGGDKNEEKSAWMARDFADTAGIAIASREKTIMLILSTKTHIEHVDMDVQLLSDTDLSILGQPSPAFWDYERKIRIEYNWVPEKEFKAARARILKGFLERPAIYFTDPFKKYETQARTNLKESIERLSR